MKHYLLLCAAIVLLFSSCSKEKSVSPDSGEKKYPVKFDVSGFTQIYEPQGGATGKVRTADVDSLPVTTLAYVVFKDNKVVSINTSKKGDAGFGTFTDELSSGNYQIAFGGGSPAKVERFISSDINSVLLFGDDLFYKKIPLVITNTNITQAVQLKRISSRLIVNINDAIPANVSLINIVLKDSIAYDMLSQKRVGYDNRYVFKTISATDIGKINYQIIVDNAHNNTPFTITIYYVQGGKTMSKQVPNVVCKTNMRTIISGDLFTANGAEFQLKIDPNWNDPIYQDF